jgi:CRP-like cAMP-binding protein
VQVKIQSTLLQPPVLTASARQTLFWQGDDCNHVYQVHSGIIRGVSLSQCGQRQIIAFFFAGDQIGLPITSTYRYSAEAVTEVTYIRQTHNQWRSALVESCQRDGEMLRSIGAEQDPIYRRGMILGRQGALPRVAAFLCSIVDRLPGETVSLKLPMPQLDIADYLVLSPETVCRSLRRLRQMAIIDMPAHDELIVHDRSALELAAHK